MSLQLGDTVCLSVSKLGTGKIITAAIGVGSEPYSFYVRWQNGTLSWEAPKNLEKVGGMTEAF